MKKKLDAQLKNEWKELTENEPIKPQWGNEELGKAITAIKKARGMATNTKDEVNKKIEKNRVYNKGVTLTEQGKEALLKQADTESDSEEVTKETIETFEDKEVDENDTPDIIIVDDGKGKKKRLMRDENEMVSVRLIQDVERFFFGAALNGKWFGPFKKGSRLRVPQKIADVLERGKKI